MNQRERNAWIEAAKEQVLQNAVQSDGCEAELMMLYDECANSLENEIRSFYSRYAKDNQLTEAEASAYLTGREFTVWKKSLESYLEDIHGQGNGSKVLLELNTLAAKSQVSRKEQLLSNIYRNMITLAGCSETELTSLLSGLVETNYERKLYDIQTIGGVAWNMAKIDEKLLKQMLSYPWSGKNYSESLWGDTDKLASLARRELTLGFMAGASVDKMAREINAVMGKGHYAAARLVRTEASYFANQGQILAYREAGVEKYRFLGGGCEICARLNGQEFSVDDAKAGENLPPIHPNCKCTTVAAYTIPVFKERDGSPLTDNPKFEEWKRRYMEEADSVDQVPEGKKKGIFSSLRERRAAADMLKPYASKVKVAGAVDLGNYRKAAAEIGRQLKKTPIGKLDGIEVFEWENEPNKLASARGKTLRLSDRLLNDPGYFYSGAVQNWQKRMEYTLGQIRAKMAQAASSRLREQYGEMLELKKYARGNVLYQGKEIACAIQHEMMHIILNDRGMKADRKLKECYNRAMQDGTVYQISHRASANEREFAAEAVVMYENGEPLPDYIKNLIEELKTYEA